MILLAREATYGHCLFTFPLSHFPLFLIQQLVRDDASPGKQDLALLSVLPHMLGCFRSAQELTRGV